MIWRVEIANRDGFFDAFGAAVRKGIEDLGAGNKVKEVKTVQVYLIEGDVNEGQLRRICEDLLIDKVTQFYDYQGHAWADREKEFKAVEVAYNPGVMDPVEESTKKGIRDLGISGVHNVRTCQRYLIRTALSERELHALSEKIIFNKLIQHIVKSPQKEIVEPPPYDFRLIEVDILSAGDEDLRRISKDGHLFLNLEEMTAIKGYFRKLGRNPTDCELETLAQTWSEHCKHKTMRGLIEYDGRVIDNLLKNTVMKVTRELKKDWCVSVFKDNSGVIRFDSKRNVCFKVETHNHPSALEPYGGAGTGIGGVIRDPLGTGQGAKPIVNTDIFCFAPPDFPYKRLPKGVLHPKRVMKGVVSGVRDYGNKMGIPTANGAVLFDEDFLGNPLVFCGNVGVMPKERSFKKVRSGDLVVLVGGRTGRDGIHGATFSSGELTTESETISAPCVQIGNPITEKKMTDTILEARDRGLFNAITDCGGGGLSSAVGEMGEELGVELNLEKVPLKYKGLTYTEIWISEAQERMILACDPKKIDELKKVFEREDVEVTVVGRFTGDARLRLFYDGKRVAELDMRFLHEGLPKVTRRAVWKEPNLREPKLRAKRDLTGELMGLLSNWNIASKEWIIRQYDHEVQGGSVLKPLQGLDNDGPGDACVVRPVLDSKKGIILSCGINPDYGKIDPYWMAASAIDEALRQVVAVGGEIAKAAILDNFCWGNTDKPDRLGGLVRAAVGCYDIAKGYGVPFISGKDSLNNEYAAGRKTISIPPTLLISCISVMDDVSRAVSMDAKEAGNPVYIVGMTRDELGGSQYYKNKGFTGRNVPRVDPAKGKRLMTALSRAIERGLVRSCHDSSDGGIAVALAEMAFAGGLGMKIYLKNVLSDKALPDDKILFSESNTRFIVEVPKRMKARFESALKGVPCGEIGVVTGERRLAVYGLDARVKISARIDELREVWKGAFKGL